MNRIELIHFTKTLKRHKVLDDISVSMESGKIYGLYGRNGSGKTMLLRAIAGLIFPDSGKIMINGKELHKEIRFPESMGLLIENMELLPQYTGFENLKILAKIKKIASEEDIIHTLESVGLDPTDKRKVRTYSLGMKQKLAIAQAVFENPDLILLDEPTNALDEEGIQRVRELFIQRKTAGATIVIASHNREDLTILTDQVWKMENGKLSSS